MGLQTTRPNSQDWKPRAAAALQVGRAQEACRDSAQQASSHLQAARAFISGQERHLMCHAHSSKACAPSAASLASCAHVTGHSAPCRAGDHTSACCSQPTSQGPRTQKGRPHLGDDLRGQGGQEGRQLLGSLQAGPRCSVADSTQHLLSRAACAAALGSAVTDNVMPLVNVPITLSRSLQEPLNLHATLQAGPRGSAADGTQHLLSRAACAAAASSGPDCILPLLRGTGGCRACNLEGWPVEFPLLGAPRTCSGEPPAQQLGMFLIGKPGHDTHI